MNDRRDISKPLRYVVRAYLENEAGDVQAWLAVEDDAPYVLVWDSMDEAVKWMNDGDGELFAHGCTMDAPEGYWLDDVIAESITQEELDAMADVRPLGEATNAE